MDVSEVKKPHISARLPFFTLQNYAPPNHTQHNPTIMIPNVTN